MVSHAAYAKLSLADSGQSKPPRKHRIVTNLKLLPPPTTIKPYAAHPDP
ncbi:hypothetical protein HMPREF1978_00385 [Actinomyces graevenitzii F0530]|uniref:Uncharacterized protein n=1 Tax=Actinomyces graevenitzii F0530 TaxID=1321817 RepID=U1Q5C7_9ACTO|nr:hypothetical protein HMPREF1978_00385 [Actinomyces graevenitzii F0530]